MNSRDQIYKILDLSMKLLKLTNSYETSSQQDTVINESLEKLSRAYKSLSQDIITNEAASVGATSTAAIASVPNPHISPGPARGKRSYIGSPGKSGTRSPPQPKPKKQKPSDNALDMKNTSIFGAPLRRK